MSVLAGGRGMRRVRRGWFEVARPRRNDGTRTTVGGWVDGWLVGRKGRTAARESGGRVTNRTRGRKRVTDSLATLYAT